MSILHCSDLHLNFLDTASEFQRLFNEINVLKASAVVITGDISEAPSIVEHLNRLRDNVNAPVFYVLGNHDFYRGSIHETRDRVELLNSSKLCYLPSKDVAVELGNGVCITGHDGWSDGGYSNWFASGVCIMADYQMISELRHRYFAGPHSLFDKLQSLASECAVHIRTVVDQACKAHTTVVFATHVPPFPESSLYQGKICNPRWLPNFSSKLAGDALLEVAKNNPNTQIVVLCGHTHCKATYQPLPNLVCHTAQSCYGQPWTSVRLVPNT